MKYAHFYYPVTRKDHAEISVDSFRILHYNLNVTFLFELLE